MNTQKPSYLIKHANRTTTALVTAAVLLFGIFAQANVSAAAQDIEISEIGTSIGNHAMRLVCEDSTKG